MRLMPDRAALPWHRGRKSLIALLILMLILLPLYLWPVRGGLAGLPGASGLFGSPQDPRDPAAVATIPSDVWDALMRRATAPPAGPRKPRNLTMISELESGSAAGLPRSGFHGPTPEPGGTVTTALLGSPDPIESKSGEAGPPSSSGSFTWGPFNREPGGGSGWSGGGLPGAPTSGLFGAGGPGFSGPLVRLDPDDLSASAAPGAAPEPATIVLIGSNFALLTAAAWRRRRRQESDSIG